MCLYVCVFVCMCVCMFLYVCGVIEQGALEA
jgi:hypothetical protein